MRYPTAVHSAGSSAPRKLGFQPKLELHCVVVYHTTIIGRLFCFEVSPLRETQSDQMRLLGLERIVHDKLRDVNLALKLDYCV